MIQPRIVGRNVRLRAGACAVVVGAALIMSSCTTHRDFGNAAGATSTLPGGAGVTSPASGETLPPLAPVITIAGDTVAPPVNGTVPGSATPGGGTTLNSVASLPPPLPSTSVANSGSGNGLPTTVPKPPSATKPPASAPTTPPTTKPAPPKSNCSDSGSTGGASNNAGTQSTLVGAAIRTGLHECFERIVIELQGTGSFPGYSVQYGSGYAVSGSAVLVVTLGSNMTAPDGSGYSGPTDIVPPSSITHIRELRLVSDGGGSMTWAIGIDRTRKVKVSRETSPARLVIDVETG